MLPKGVVRVEICREWDQWANGRDDHSEECMLEFISSYLPGRPELLEFTHAGDQSEVIMQWLREHEASKHE